MPKLSAFPIGGDYVERGMSLRDWFAGLAMVAELRAPCSPEEVAHRAYQVADAMLAQRAASEALKVAP